jgi:hypothetical protein
MNLCRLELLQLNVSIWVEEKEDQYLENNI